MRKHNRIPNRARQVVLRADPTLGPHIWALVDSWIEHSGPEWTADRLKSIWNAAKHSRAGNTDLAVQVYRSGGIAFKLKNGYPVPKGVYGTITLRFILAQRPQILKRMSTLFRLYTSIKIEDITPKQVDKARCGINNPSTVDGEFSISDHLPRLGLPTHVELVKPKLTKLRPYTYVYSPDPVVEDKRPYARFLRSMISAPYSPYYEGERYTPVDNLVLEELVPPNISELMKSEAMFPGVDIDHPGRIWFIQEAGAKARVVAQPCAYLQFALQPVQEFLDRLISTKEEICVHDQNRGAYFSMRAMEEGIKTYCFDLSSATDRFPLYFQQDLLDYMGLESVSASLEQLSQDPWLVPQVNDEEWSYQVGQPMGLVVSFPLFSLSHWALIKSIEIGLEDRGDTLTRVDGKTFMTVGDDVIIVDPLIAKYYEEVMTRMGVEINPLKSLISDRMCEFAGFLTILTNRGVSCFRPYKYDLRHKLIDQINLYESLGRKAMAGHKDFETRSFYYDLTRSWRNPDLSPLIKGDEKGGILPELVDENSVSQLIYKYWGDCRSWSSDDLTILDMQLTYARELLGKAAIESRETEAYGEFDFYVGLTDNEDTKSWSPAPFHTDPLVRDFQMEWERTYPSTSIEVEKTQPPNTDEDHNSDPTSPPMFGWE